MAGSLADSGQAIRAFDVLARNVDTARESVATLLVDVGQPPDIAESLSSQWISQGDFLLGTGSDGSLQADFVVGNPPYVRLEDVPAEVSAAYRSECSTMRGRADIYVGFFEKGLSMLGPEGRLAFICADRWMHNQYGERLRSLVGFRIRGGHRRGDARRERVRGHGVGLSGDHRDAQRAPGSRPCRGGH